MVKYGLIQNLERVSNCREAAKVNTGDDSPLAHWIQSNYPTDASREDKC